jgi:hypothetical protein
LLLHSLLLLHELQRHAIRHGTRHSSPTLLLLLLLLLLLGPFLLLLRLFLLLLLLIAPLLLLLLPLVPLHAVLPSFRQQYNPPVC